MRLFSIVAAAVLVASAAGAAEYRVFIGTYTGPNSQGIYTGRFDTKTGKLSELTLAGETANPSFVAVHPNRKYLYAVSEASGGTVSAFSIDAASGKLTLLNSVSSHGSGPCYVRVDNTGKDALVANYGSGSFAVLPIGSDGKLREASSFIQDTGHGSNPKRQEKPHAHSLNQSPDNKFAVGADLGLDKVFVFRFDPVKGTLTPNDTPFAEVKPGSGPRHFAFHPSAKFAYVTNEIASTVTAFTWNRPSGALREIQTISTLPQDFKGENTTAEIQVHLSGKFLYDSNRGHDSIAVFTIDQKTGKLTAVDHTPTQGNVPRNFGIDPSGSFLIAANQKSDNLVVFRIDNKTGRLTPTGQKLAVGSPVCVKFMALR